MAKKRQKMQRGTKTTYPVPDRRDPGKADEAEVEEALLTVLEAGMETACEEELEAEGREYKGKHRKE